MKQKLLSLFFVLTCLIGVSMAQNRQVSGKVTSATDGTPLSGVSISVAGTSTATQTDGSGNYSISVGQGVNLIFSYVGYATQRISVGSQSVINVRLVDNENTLDEVVVTGVGVATSKKKVAIAVESLKSEDMPNAPTGSLDQALVGKIAGAQITSTSGQPGQQANIVLRGINTLGNTQPMIMVDGIQINAGGNSNGSDNNTSSRLSDLDLSNVDRVEVIQGAAAATIYGAQGANGVIQIFTKKGKLNQRPTITLNARSSFDNAAVGKFRVANNHFFNTDSEGYIIGGNGKRLSPDENGYWGEPSIPTVTGTLVSDKPYKEQVYNQLDQLFKKNVLTQNTNLNIAGGGEAIDYSISASNLSQGSLVHGRYDRYNVSSNLGVELFKNFTIRSISQLMYSDNGTGGITGANNIYSGIGSALSSRRYWDIKFQNADGHYVADPEDGNSVNAFYTQQFRDYNAKTARMVQNFNLNYKFDRFLELDYKYGVDNYRYDFKDFIKYQEEVKTPGDGIAPTSGRITHDRDVETFQNSLLSAFFKTDFQKDFNLSAPIQTTTHLAFDWRKRNYQNITAQGTGFSSFPPYSISTAAENSSSEDIIEFITYGYLVNQRIDYGSLFGVSGGFRVDYASTFGGADFKPFLFPRADAYFNVGDLLGTDKIYEFKLRTAYGEAGTQPGAYDRFVTLNSGTIGSLAYLSLKSTARNPDLSVQVSKEFEVGTDLGFNLSQTSSWFKTISLNATYWNRVNNDIIRELDLAPSSGASALLDNAITIKARGFQFSLDAPIYSGENFRWKFGARFGQSKSIIDKISNGKDIAIGDSGSGQFVLREGEEVATFFGRSPLSSIDQRKADGTHYLDQSNAANYEVVNGMVVNKMSKAVQFTSDNVKIGNPNPKFNMTFLNSFNIYKNLDVDFQLDWYYGNDVYNQTKQWLYRDFLHSDFDQEITVGGETGAYVAYYNSLYNTNTTNGYFVEKGSFLRLRNLAVSYNLASLVNNERIKDLRISVTGRNLFTITNYSGLDPEGAAKFNNPIERGVDLYTFPNIRSFQFGVVLGF